MKQQSTTTRSRGFAMTDALALVAVSGVLAALGLATSSQPGTAHRSDQLNLLSEKRFRSLWLTRADVERNLEKREGY